ncbi:HSP20-like chaperone [Tothia fuscella]|uniref:HSP20-like chaperone n=1 Tax=Tothia fuscella TaxID=1048955 RepID=A0A9P4NHL9_9PEZI|nr:HSP20-like chaperone [Tothia fuscella]
MAYPYYPTLPVYGRAFYGTTTVDPSFPEHHWPLEHTRHRIGDATHAIGEFFTGGDVLLDPASDIRETTKKFYIDVELPGLRSREALHVKWTNPRTLFVHARIERPKIAEIDELVKAEDKTPKPEHAVHHLLHERRVGKFARSFYFEAEVDTETMVADMSGGLLSIVVEKKPHEQKPAKSVEVNHSET